MRNLNKYVFKIVIFTWLLCVGLLFVQNVKAEDAYTTKDGTWEYRIMNGTAVIAGYHHPSGATWDVEIPETITHGGKAYPVTEIYGNTFKTLALTSVEIPAGVKAIGAYAFQNCTAMTKVTFAENSKLETIGEYAFGLTAITEIEIPASVKTLGNQLFNGCNSLTSVTFEEGSNLETIGNSVFSTCAITQIDLPSGLKTIGNNAFAGQPLTGITIPKTVTTIGAGAFSACESLTRVTFEKVSNVTAIGDEVFEQTALTAVEIPASVKTIGYQTFYNCKALQTLTFEEGSKLETIGESAFACTSGMTGYCSLVTDITLPASVKTIGKSAFANCRSLQTFTIPQDSVLETIGDSAFSGAGEVEEICFPVTLKSIGTDAFRFSGIKSFEFQNGLESIGDYAFCGNKEEVIVIPPSVTTVGTGAFSSSNNLEVIYYPTDLADQMANSGVSSTPKGEYTISDTEPPVVTITYTGTIPADLEVPSTIPGAEGAQMQVGDIPALSTSYSTDCKVTVLSQLADRLPAGYTFETPATKLPAGKTTECTAVYTSGGTTYKFTTKIAVAAHEENKTILYTGAGEKEATCTENGLAHTECDICHTPFTENIEIEATGHQTTEIRDAKKSTCAVEGYSGDTWCLDCDTMIGKGKAIAKKAHAWNAGVVTKAATRLKAGIKTFTCTVCKETKTETIKALGAHAKGTKLPDEKNLAVYKVTKAGISGGTVTYVKPVNKNKKQVTIPATVKIEGITYKVTEIAKNAFKNNKKLTKLTIGKNVSKIGKKAFYGCKKLKNITIKTKKLTDKKVGAKAFAKIKTKVTIKVPKKKYNAYKKLLFKKGVSKRAIFKK